MIKKQYKWTAFPVMALFIWLLAVVSKPLIAVEFGMKAGGNLSFVFGYDETYIISNSIQNLLGLKAGLFISIPLGRGTALQPEINYVTKGMRYYGRSHGMESLLLHYLEIPVFVNIPLFGKSTFIFFGPYFGILLGSSPTGNRKYEWIDDGNELRHSDVGLGAGIRWRLKKVFVELQYNLGKNVLFNPTSSPTGIRYHPELMNHCAALLIGYVFQESGR